MNHDYFWLTEAQFARLEPFLPICHLFHHHFSGTNRPPASMMPACRWPCSSSAGRLTKRCCSGPDR